MRLARLTSAASLVGLAASCGARTGLDEPCWIPLEREEPAIVFLVQWNAHCDDYGGDCWSGDLFDGRDLFEASRSVLAALVPMLDGIARMGAMPSQTISVDDPIPDLPDGGWNPEWCATPPELAVPIGDLQGALVQRYFSLARWPHGSVNGQGTVLPNLPVVERALLDAGGERTRRFVVLIDSGRRGCPGLPDSSTRIDDSDYAQIRAAFAGLASRGVRTLVVGLRAFTEDGEPFLAQERILNAEAEGGGLARAAGSGDPIQFYDYADLPAVESIVHREIVVPFHCTLYAAEPVTDPTAVELSPIGAGEAPRHDPTRVDGWDFLDDARTTVGLFGAACERTVREGTTYRFLVLGGSC